MQNDVSFRAEQLQPDLRFFLGLGRIAKGCLIRKSPSQYPAIEIDVRFEITEVNGPC